jgi:hypothetical protein
MFIVHLVVPQNWQAGGHFIGFIFMAEAEGNIMNIALQMTRVTMVRSQQSLQLYRSTN